MISKILAKWWIFVGIVCIIKALAMFEPPTGELLRWSLGASLALESVTAGRLPPISITGPYSMMFLVLAPFFWLWKILPIEHAAMAVLECYANSILACSSQTPISALVGLGAVMKIPNFVFDLLTGALIYRLVWQITNSRGKSSLGFMSWYLNPFNFGWLYLNGYLGDLIASFTVVFGVLLASNNKWFRTGICTCIASVLRIFPVVTLPFFIQNAKAKGIREYLILLSGFLFLIVPWLIAEYATTGATLATILNVPLERDYLLDFIGANFPGGGKVVGWMPVVLAIQLYVVLRLWRANANAVHVVTVSVLALLLGAGPVSQQNLFLWVSPLLSICLALHPEDFWIFILTFSTDITCDYCTWLSRYTFLGSFVGYWTPPWNWYLNPTFAGAFYAFKTTYLIKLNLENITRFW